MKSSTQLPELPQAKRERFERELRTAGVRRRALLTSTREHGGVLRAGAARGRPPAVSRGAEAARQLDRRAS